MGTGAIGAGTNVVEIYESQHKCGLYVRKASITLLVTPGRLQQVHSSTSRWHCGGWNRNIFISDSGNPAHSQDRHYRRNIHVVEPGVSGNNVLHQWRASTNPMATLVSAVTTFLHWRQDRHASPGC